jgi:hypothetical protein
MQRKHSEQIVALRFSKALRNNFTMKHQFKTYNTFFSSSAIALAAMLLLICCLSNPLYCQVYNYSPINYRDIETNPAIVASESKNNQVNINHINTFSAASPFSITSVELSKYFKSIFSGFGVTMNNTTMKDGIHYNYIALSAAYRNILFNKAHIKIGATYKLISANAPSGSFDYYSFIPSGANRQRNVTANLNLSLLVSSPSDKYFISISSLNNNRLWNGVNQSIQFPKYYVFHLGNLMSLFDGANRGSEISLTAFSAYSLVNKKTIYNEAIDFKFVLNVTRSCSIRYGSRVGYTESRYMQYTPFITFFKRKSAVTFSYNFYSKENNIQSVYPSTIQLNLIYNL